jgi:AraC-like DNA-binding protein
MLPPASFAAHCKTETGSTIALPEAGQILRPSAPDRRDHIRIHGEAARLAETRPKILVPAAVVRAMEYELGGLLVRCLTNSETRIAGAAIRQAAEIMTRFENVLTADPHRGLDMAELRQVLGVTERSFSDYCRSFLGVSARRYVRLHRLKLAHVAILRADPRTARIAELARYNGFTNAGRFARIYRALYGEAPSATLRRARDG